MLYFQYIHYSSLTAIAKIGGGLKMNLKRIIGLVLSVALCLSGLQTFWATDKAQAGKPPRPEITITAEEFTKGVAYSFDVTSDMNGLLSVSIDREEATRMLAEADPISAGEAFTVNVDEMPYLDEVNFIITVRPESEDFNNPAVSDLKILTVKASETDAALPYEKLETQDDAKPMPDDYGFSWEYAKTGGAASAVDAFMTGNIKDGFTLFAGSKTKVESGRDSLSYYYTTVPSDKAFRISGKLKVTSNIYANNQSYIGFIVKNDALEDNDGSVNPSMLFGGLSSNTVDTVSTANILATRIKEESVVKDDGIFSYKPHVWYDLELQKIGDDYYTYFDGNFVAASGHVGFESGTLSVGAVATKDVTAEFKDVRIELLDEKNTPVSPAADTAAKSADNYNVLNDRITSLKVVHKPIKISYALNEAFDAAGLTVAVVRASGKTEILGSDEYTLSGFDSTTPGEKMITVSNSYKNPAVSFSTTASFAVTIKDASVSGIEISKKPIKTSYFVGQKAPETESGLLSGALITAVHSDGSVHNIDLDDGNGTGFTTDYSADGFTSGTPGEKTVTISYMGKTAGISFIIEEIIAEGLYAQAYPDKTTYTVGEVFDKTGLVVMALNNDGSLTSALSEGSDYGLDISNYNKDASGQYEIKLTGAGKYSHLTGSIPVTVREDTDYSKGWDWVVFGQSALLANNTCELGEIGEDKSITLTTTDNSGKLSDGHDGINYYYRKLDITDNFELSADIKVTSIGSTSNNSWIQGNQEGFGLMLRDHIAEHGDTSVWRSSAMYAGTHGKGNEFAAYSRDNRVEYEQEGTAKSAAIAFTDDDKVLAKIKANPDDNGPETTARITIGRRNNNFYGSITTDSDTREFSFDNDIPLDYYDKDHYYVGFFTARNACVEFKNASLTVTDSRSDKPGSVIEKPLAAPTLTVYSLDYSATPDYRLLFGTNADGRAYVYYNSEKIAEVDVLTYKMCEVKTTLSGDSNSFHIEFYPDTTKEYADYSKISSSVSVGVTGVDGDLYVSPDGTGNGKPDSPMDFDEAVKKIKPGNSIILTEGDYGFLIVPKYNGSDKNAGYKKIVADGKVTANLLNVAGDFWHIKGIRVLRGEIHVSGSDNVIELCTVSRSINTGFTIGRSGDRNMHGNISVWPARNLVLNCESYDNRDDGENDADGFGSKLTVGEGNRFVGSVAHHNIDDGWDFYAKGVKIGVNTIDYCIAYRNGQSLSFPGARGADGNGFKLGGEGVPVMHKVTNSIAFENRNCGFTSNSNPYATVINNAAFDNFGGNIFLGSYTNVYERDYVVRDFFSFRKNIFPERDDIIEKYIDGKVDKTKGRESADHSVYLYTVTDEKAANDLGRTVTGEFFEDISSYAYTGEDLSGGKSKIISPDESLVNNASKIVFDFLKLKPYAYEH